MKYDRQINNDHSGMDANYLNTLIIKRRFICFTSITASFDNYERMGLCPTRNEDNSTNSKVFRKEGKLQ